LVRIGKNGSMSALLYLCPSLPVHVPPRCAQRTGCCQR
jgi:hypothetical protein